MALGRPGVDRESGEGAPGRLAGITLAVAEPDAVCGRWGRVLGVASGEREGAPLLRLDGADVRFVPAASELDEGLVEISVSLPSGLPGGAQEIELAGVKVRSQPAPAGISGS